MKYNFDLELVNNNSLLLMLEQIKRNSVILEFGPANGRLTKYLKQQLNCDVYLAEIDEEAGKEALQYGKDLVVGDVENMEWFDRYGDLRFDYILFADVLEHLRNPKTVLAKSKLLLKQNGSVIISVPNMGHNSVLIDLMNNRLNYTNVGLLDNTHIHFFTQESLENMIKECDLYPCKRFGTYCEAGKTEIPNSIYDVEGISPEFWNSRKYGSVYQFVYELKKGKEYITEEQNLLNPYYNSFWAQIYKDNGTGMNEEHADKRFLNLGAANHRMGISVEPDCTTLRFDPINTSAVIKVNCFSVRHGESEEVITDFGCNAEHRFDNIYVFETGDPMFLFNTEQIRQFEQPEIIVDYDILCADSLLIKKMNTIVDVLNEKAVQTETRHAEEETALKEEIEKLREENSKIRKKYDELKSESVQKNNTGKFR